MSQSEAAYSRFAIGSFFSDGGNLELPRGRRLKYMFDSIIMLQAATIATQYDVDV